MYSFIFMKYSRFAVIFLFLILVGTLIFLFAKLGYIPQGLIAQLTGSAPRAALSIAPESKKFGVGEEVVVSVMLTARTKINLVDLSLEYPSDKLEPVSVSKENSLANLWIEEPSIADNSGVIQITGGIISTEGFSGKGKLFTVTFRAKSEGTLRLVLTNASVLAHDGFGTNVLDVLSSAEYQILESPVERSPFDLNNDGLLDLKDVRVFIDSWGKTYDPVFDFNANRKVDFDDFLTLVRSVSPR